MRRRNDHSLCLYSTDGPPDLYTRHYSPPLQLSRRLSRVESDATPVRRSHAPHASSEFATQLHHADAPASLHWSVIPLPSCTAGCSLDCVLPRAVIPFVHLAAATPTSAPPARGILRNGPQSQPSPSTTTGVMSTRQLAPWAGQGVLNRHVSIGWTLAKARKTGDRNTQRCRASPSRCTSDGSSPSLRWRV